MFGDTCPSLVGQTASAGTSGDVLGEGTGGPFGGKANEGTTLKCNPITSIALGGQSTNVNTKHQVITAMKEYENKSFEELRMEDYTANRKGPSSTGLLGQGMTQVDNKAGGLFGQSTASSAAFGTSSGGLFGGQQTQQSGGLFGQKTGFGTTGSTGLGFGDKSTSAFGQTATKSLFGQPASSQSMSLFGSTPASAGLFGGQQTQQTGGLFGQKTGFGTTGSTGLGFGDTSTSAFGQTATKSLFGQPASTQSMSLFGSTPASGTTGFGTGSTFGGTTGFGQTQSSSLFGKRIGFGTTTISTGLTLGSGTSTGLFGQQNKTGLSLGTGGTTGFDAGTQSTNTPPAFGQKATAGTLFGAKTELVSGSNIEKSTAVKFKPVTSTDTMVESGQSTTINTRHQVITAMKEYENKSFEELRLEDYTAILCKRPTTISLLGQGNSLTLCREKNTVHAEAQSDAYHDLFGNSGGLFPSTISDTENKVKAAPLLGNNLPLSISDKTTPSPESSEDNDLTPSSESSDDDEMIKDLQHKKAKLKRAIKVRRLQDEIQSLEAKLSEVSTKDPEPGSTVDAASIGATPVPSNDTETHKVTDSAPSPSSQSLSELQKLIMLNETTPRPPRKIRKVVRRTRRK